MDPSGIRPCLYRAEYACLTDLVQKPKAGTLGWDVHSFVVIQRGSLWSTRQDWSVASFYQHICPLFYQQKKAEQVDTQTLRCPPFSAQTNWAGQICITSSHHNYYHNTESKAFGGSFRISSVYGLYFRSHQHKRLSTLYNQAIRMQAGHSCPILLKQPKCTGTAEELVLSWRRGAQMGSAVECLLLRQRHKHWLPKQPWNPEAQKWKPSPFQQVFWAQWSYLRPSLVMKQ